MFRAPATECSEHIFQGVQRTINSVHSIFKRVLIAHFFGVFRAPSIGCSEHVPVDVHNDF
jgi:hypothetical protein